MNTTRDEPECYGRIFPDLSRVLFNRPLEGRAFTVLVESSGMGISGRTLSVNREGWQRCTACPSYHACYDLSVATLLLHGTIQGFGVSPAI